MNFAALLGHNSGRATPSLRRTPTAQHNETRNLAGFHLLIARSCSDKPSQLCRLLVRFEGRRWFPVKRASVAKAENWYHRYGRWSLLFSWVPVIGDPLTVVAGVLREPLPVFVALVTVAKVGRYIAVAAIQQGWFS